MNQEEKLKLSKQVMRIAGVFTLVIASLLLINFAQLKKYKPLESKTLNSLVEQLKNDPRNDQLKEEIRDFDLIVRKAYFTSEWQVRTGTYLLLFGGILFAVSLKIFTDLQHKIGMPEAQQEAYHKSRKIASRWLLITGLAIFGLAFIAAFSSTNYLEAYYTYGLNESPPDQLADSTIEIVRIVDSSASLGPGTFQVESGTKVNIKPQPNTKNLTPEKTGIKTETPFGLAEFKKQHNTFRGPMGLGISYHKNIPVSWNGSSGTNILWKLALSKPGFNSPIIWGDKLFLAGADEKAQIVSCYNRNTGQLLWEKKADNIPGSPAVKPKVTDDTGLSAPTMAADGYRVYALFATGDMISFDMNGNRIWARNMGVPKNHYGHSSSLFVWAGNLLVQYDTGAGGRMFAMEGSSGDMVWDISRDNNISWASPILVEIDDIMQIITTSDPNVAGYDVQTGEEKWKLKVMMGEVGASCAYSDGLVFANNEYASLVAIKPGSNASVEWENYDYMSEASSPVAKDGLLYLATSYGVFVCYEAKTGKQVWEKDFGTTFYSSPIIADGKIYLMDNSGVMHIFKEGREGTIIGEPALGEGSLSVPAFAEGRLYIRGVESLYCIGK